MFGGIFYDYLEQPWELARGALREHLEQLQTTLSHQWARNFNRDGSIKSDAISGDSSTSQGRVYVSNEGENGSPAWAKVNVNTGVKNRLQLTNFVEASSGVLLGHRVATQGNYEEITLGPGIEFSGATITAPGATYTRTFLFLG